MKGQFIMKINISKSLIAWIDNDHKTIRVIKFGFPELVQQESDKLIKLFSNYPEYKLLSTNPYIRACIK